MSTICTTEGILKLTLNLSWVNIFKVLTTQGVAASQKIDIDPFMNQLLANAPKRFFIKELAFIFKDSKAHRDFARAPNQSVAFIIRDPLQAVLSHYKLILKSKKL